MTVDRTTVAPKTSIKRVQHTASPFLSVIARQLGYMRPMGLWANQQSILSQTDRDLEQIFIIDEEGQGLAQANRSLANIGHLVVGEYVIVLDDDDFLCHEDFVSTLKSIHARFCTPMLSCTG